MKNNYQIMKYINYGLLTLIFSLVSVEAYSIEEKSNKAKSNDLALFEQAILLSSSKDWRNAAKIFLDVATRNPEWPEPKNNLAVALYNMGKLDLARQALDEAVISLPSFKVAQANRQRLYDYAATIEYYQVVDIAEEPESPRLELLTEVQLTPDNTGPKPPPPTQAVMENNSAQSDEIEQQIRESVLDWSKAWSNSDIENYLSAYSARFKPAEPGKDYAQWREDRTAKLRFTKVEGVSLKSIDVYLNGNGKQALAQFIQHYRSNKFQDKVIKQLHLALEEGRWLIRAERVLQPLN